MQGRWGERRQGAERERRCDDVRAAAQRVASGSVCKAVLGYVVINTDCVLDALRAAVL